MRLARNSGANAALVTAPVFKTGGTSYTTFGGFDSHPLPLNSIRCKSTVLERELQLDPFSRQQFAAHFDVRVDKKVDRFVPCFGN